MWKDRLATLALVVLSGSLVVLTASVPAAAATITPVSGDNAGASALAQAVVADSSTLAGARFVTRPPAGTPNAVADSLSFFPTNGSSFGILSTGNASLADTPNASGSSGTDDGGASFRGDTDFDVTVLAVDLDVPAGRNCVQFDFAFYSEEFPEWVGTAYNDAFVAELDTTTWTTSGSSISAPDNFAFDAAGDPVTINSTGVTGMNELNASNTTYDGATVLLQAAHQITAGSHTLYFSIFDQGDHIYDSAVFLDNLRLLTIDPAKCQPGAKQGNLPLIVLPGITGSYLRSPSGEAWPRALDMLPSTSDSFLDNLQLADDGLSPRDPSDPSYDISVWTDHGKQGIIDEIDLGCVPLLGCAYRIEPYTPTFNYLESHGYQENVNLFPLAFDWRKSAGFNSDVLLTKIDLVLAQTGAPKVNILAHSQGGLVTEAALGDPRSIGKVARVMTMGTPYLGATKALGVLDYAEPCQNEVLSICLLNPDEVQKLVTNFPGFLDLLPSRAFYGQASLGPVLTLFDRNGDGGIDGFLDFNTERAKLVDRNLGLIDQSTAFHDGADLWSPADPSVQLTRLVGSGIGTIETVVEYREEECSGILWWRDCRMVEKSQFAYGNGDGTVPLHSADLFYPTRGFDDRGGAPNAYAPGVSHGDLVKDEDALAYAVANFAGAGTSAASAAAAASVSAESGMPGASGPSGATPALDPEAAAEAAARPGTGAKAGRATAAVAAAGGITDQPSLLAGDEVLVKGSVYGLVTDAAGNRLGTPDTSGVELNEIPGAVFNRAVDTGSFFVTRAGTYQGSWTATADGEVQFVARDYANDAISAVASTAPIAVSAGAVLSLGLDTASDPGSLSVAVDDDGGGSVDRTVQFGDTVQGPGSADVTAPVSHVTVQNFVDPAGKPMANVTITATDEPGGSGVDRIEYALDASNTSGVYTSTLTVPGTGKIIVRAIDRAGNVEAPYQSVRLSKAVGLGAGGFHGLALNTDASVWAWGWNGDGELGDGTTTTSSALVKVSNLTGVTAVGRGPGALHSLAVTSDGSVWAWGNNLRGQLGNGTTTNSSVPVKVSGLTGATGVAAGDFFSLAVKSDRTAWAWGVNTYGQLGNGKTTNSSVPVKVSNLTGATAVSAGNEHSLALKTDGTVLAWGWNPYGQLGNGKTTNSSTPVKVSNLTGVTAIAAGRDFSMALKSDGTVWAWGSGFYGNLGNGANTNSSVPVKVSNLTGATAIAAGNQFSLALKSDGTVWAWGRNTYGQLGNNTNTNSNVPVKVSNLTGVSAVAAGWDQSLALKSDGTLWTWGSSTTMSSRVPVQVPG